jgi:hypothetical protein
MAKTESIVEKSRRRAKTGGRSAGTPNKVSGELKEMILQALDGAGGISYLQDVADRHPAAFLSLVGKVLPMTVLGPGEGGSHVFVSIERRIIGQPVTKPAE